MMPMAVQRLREALHIRGNGIDAIAKLLQVHPLLPDDYVRSGVAVDDDSSGRFGSVRATVSTTTSPEPAELAETT